MENKRTLKRLPVGIQTFEKIVDEDYLYIDKTECIYKMLRHSNYIFLSRPRRFGKSLLVSTLQSYFEGKRELFKGLYIHDVEKEWTEYPVLKFSMASAKHTDAAQLNSFLGTMLEREEQRWGIDSHRQYANERLMDLILTAHKMTGRKVVVLIDEYDAPLLDVSNNGVLLDEMRQIMRNFYSPLKDCDPYLQFVFITGITKFSQLSVFSELNNLKNISLLPEFATICGISEEEVLNQMSDYLDDYAEANGITRGEAMSELKHQYDGYHFTWPSPDMYNPFSLLNSLQDKMLKSYWFESGTPTFLIEKLREFHFVPSMFKPTMKMASAFDAPMESLKSVTPLLYQSGYITIKGYDKVSRLYTLDVPNREIRIGLMESLLPNYVQVDPYNGLTSVGQMYLALYNDNLEEMLRILQEYLLTIPQCDNTNYEGHYQQLLYVIFSLLGRYVDVEVRTSDGRVDMVMNSGKALYLFELKLNKSAEAAMSQINLKDYPSRFALSGLPIVKVGINFDSVRHTIDDWVIE
ncbi:MAG: AAA family ATPase [Bacteroidales bacterium]|nr:AAA family ATPase [Bacteroidales bacterium]